MVLTGFFIAGAAITEFQTLDDAGFFKKLHRAIDGGDGDGVVLMDRAAIQLVDVRVILGVANDTDNDLALVGHSNALFVTFLH